MFLTAVEMLFQKRNDRRSKNAEEDEHAQEDPSVFPIATPLLAGPGAMAAMILLTGEHAGDPLGQAMVLGVMLAVLAVSLVLFVSASTVEKLLGATAISVFTRVLGVLLAALAIQFMLDGLADYGAIPRVAG